MLLRSGDKETMLYVALVHPVILNGKETWPPRKEFTLPEHIFGSAEDIGKLGSEEELFQCTRSCKITRRLWWAGHTRNSQNELMKQWRSRVRVKKYHQEFAIKYYKMNRWIDENRRFGVSRDDDGPRRPRNRRNGKRF